MSGCEYRVLMASTLPESGERERGMAEDGNGGP
jgi:hypothetical protein